MTGASEHRPQSITCTGLVCRSCKKPVATIEDFSPSSRKVTMLCAACGYRWLTDGAMHVVTEY